MSSPCTCPLPPPPPHESSQACDIIGPLLMTDPPKDGDGERCCSALQRGLCPAPGMCRWLPAPPPPRAREKPPPPVAPPFCLFCGWRCLNTGGGAAREWAVTHAHVATAAHPHRTGFRAQVTDELLKGPAAGKVLDKYGPFINLCISPVTAPFEDLNLAE